MIEDCCFFAFPDFPPALPPLAPLPLTLPRLPPLVVDLLREPGGLPGRPCPVPLLDTEGCFFRCNASSVGSGIRVLHKKKSNKNMEK